jgi:hypothetical protein
MKKFFFQFDFTGHLDEAAAVQAISDWKKELGTSTPLHGKVGRKP